jgi:competence protein ComEC
MKNKIVFICLLSLSLGLRYWFYLQTKPTYQAGEAVTLKTTLLNEPKIVASGQQMLMVDGVFVFAPRYPTYHYGDHLSIMGTVKKTQFQTNKQMQLAIDKPAIVMKENKWLAIPRIIRYTVQSTFNRYLPPDESALLLGIIFGFRNTFNKTYYDQLQVTGVLNVIAASGTNVTILAGVLLSTLGFFVKRRRALIFTIIGICFYAVLAGLDPPIVRASLMGLIALGAGLYGRQNQALFALIMTGFAMLCISPDLITNIGFQLSFLATGGLILVKPRVDSVLHLNNVSSNKMDRTKTNNQVKLPLAEDLSTTISAQITTIPILVNSFGSYSPISILVNMVVLWMIPILMIMGGLGALASLIWQPLAIPFLYCCYPFLLLFKVVVQLAAPIANATLLPKLNIWLTGGVYMILIGVLFRTKRIDKTNNEK